MYFEFFHNFYEKLIENEFKLVKNFYDNESLTEETIYIGLYKQIGPMGYFVLIINADKSNQENQKYQNLYKYFKEYLIESYEKIDVDNMIFLNILVTENADNNLKTFALQNDILYDEKIIDIMWIVELAASELIVMGEQPNKIIDIEKFIKQSLSLKNNDELKNNENISVYDVIDDSIKKEKLYIKSDNNFFVFGILIINFLVFAIMELNGGSTNTDVLIKFGAIEPNKVLFEHQYYRLFTAMFIHIGIAHLFANSLALYIFGTRVEKYFGKIFFIVIYIISGILASISSVIFSRNVAAGASGAIFGLIGATLAYCYVKSKSLDGFNLYFVIVFTIFGIAAGFMQLNVDNTAHIGGFITGYLIAYIACKFKKV